ncbi:hypothetical protein AJ80_04613 [Polytolypa hystricis UAMH7299]|uniref:Uncharacterized protein n=1 Tax=Polytolypa hystricis (strain UAMH7299) TaxID=1447883 RepID=A0A2B7YAU8_POLH7|nr:hypothetical protein AJ80_04613 [Polytolypa hystricis UAMH7299]
MNNPLRPYYAFGCDEATGGRGPTHKISAQLLRYGIKKLYIVARSKTKYDAALSTWCERPDVNVQSQEKGEFSQRVEFIPCDLGDIQDVKNAAEQILRKTDRLDMLLCNAALPISPTYTLSPQSIELIFAVNHVGHHILVSLLLPLMKATITRHKTNDARIVVTSSSLHHFCQELDLDSLTSPTPLKSACWDGVWRYGRSKLANILFTRELSQRLMDGEDDDASKHIYVNSFFPGNIATDQMDVWQHYLGFALGWAFRRVFSVMGQTPQDGAATALFLAASEKIKEGEGVRGQYYIPIGKLESTSSIAQDMDLAQGLWEWTDQRIAETLGENWRVSRV